MRGLLSVILIVVLAACSSQPVYREATANGYGYAEQQISNNYYRVSFKARGDNSGEAKAYAMRRAAELTAKQGYDWFVIVDKETVTERDNAPANHASVGYQQGTQRSMRDCSLLGCNSRTVSQPHYEMGINTTTGREQVEAVLEIRMGKGVASDNATTYPAKYE
ncbi:hypothetical protein BI198_00785 [Rheinheimera salexigens]|uniref:DUF4136 domain-containing protein n=2 Tax=Rheinheimera salexigens TaxID=1628148 RepID=A0A1E7Q9L1_9GAMM|nr:hypothetical protein BI198_00785 [Rheinheimera salexigens]